MSWICSKQNEHFGNFFQNGYVGMSCLVYAPGCLNLWAVKFFDRCIEVSIFHALSEKLPFHVIFLLLYLRIFAMTDMARNKGFLPSGPAEISVQRNQLKAIIHSLLPACTEPDLDTGAPFKAQAIIANPPAYGEFVYLIFGRGRGHACSLALSSDILFAVL